MIEVEIKFSLLHGNEQRAIEGAELIGTKINSDVYYDNKEFTLTLKDWWLRKRNANFELKLPPNRDLRNIDNQARRYEELTEEPDIINALGFSGADITTLLTDNNYKSFADLVTTRTSYKHGQYRIDIDHTNFNYSIGELELLVEDVKEVKAAEKKLIQFLAERDISYSKNDFGKVAYYLQKNSSEHFDKLVEAGVINSEA
jgi:thiamine-triphosphatase